MIWELDQLSLMEFIRTFVQMLHHLATLTWNNKKWYEFKLTLTLHTNFQNPELTLRKRWLKDAQKGKYN